MTHSSGPGSHAASEHTLRILHISDVHMRGERDGKRTWKRTEVLGQKWLDNLKELRADGKRFDIIAFTGDIADWGLAEEYADATNFVHELLRHLDVPIERLFVVPGNHDIHRRTQQAAWATFRQGMHAHAGAVSEWLADITKKPPFGFAPEQAEAVLERERAFWHWVQHDLGRSVLLPAASPHGRLGYRIALPGWPFPVHIIGLDSAWLAGDDTDHGNLWLTDDQLGLLCRDQKGKPLHGFRLALMHHPVSDLADAQTAHRLLSDRVDLLLRGHQHKPLASTQQTPGRTMRELAAGCLYEGALSNRYENAFHVIDAVLDPQGRPLRYDIRFRAWSKEGFWLDHGALYREAKHGRLTWHVQPPAPEESPPVPESRPAPIPEPGPAPVPESGPGRRNGMLAAAGLGVAVLVGVVFLAQGPEPGHGPEPGPHGTPAMDASWPDARLPADAQPAHDAHMPDARPVSRKPRTRPAQVWTVVRAEKLNEEDKVPKRIILAGPPLAEGQQLVLKSSVGEGRRFNARTVCKAEEPGRECRLTPGKGNPAIEPGDTFELAAEKP